MLKRSLIVGAALCAAMTPVLAQQPTADQVQDLQIQLTLTEQQLADTNKNFISERSSTIRLGRELNDAAAAALKKDAQIKDLTDKVAAAETARMKALSTPKNAPLPLQPSSAADPSAPGLSIPPVPAPPVQTNVDAPK